jgi:hypothetical protein
MSEVPQAMRTPSRSRRSARRRPHTASVSGSAIRRPAGVLPAVRGIAKHITVLVSRTRLCSLFLASWIDIGIQPRRIRAD